MDSGDTQGQWEDHFDTLRKKLVKQIKSRIQKHVMLKRYKRLTRPKLECCTQFCSPHYVFECSGEYMGNNSSKDKRFQLQIYSGETGILLWAQVWKEKKMLETLRSRSGNICWKISRVNISGWWPFVHFQHLQYSASKWKFHTGAVSDVYSRVQLEYQAMQTHLNLDQNMYPAKKKESSSSIFHYLPL